MGTTTSAGKRKATATKAASGAKKRATGKRSGGGGGGGGGCSSILVALAELKMIGKGTPTRSMVARMAGYDGAEQAGFKKALTGLNSKGHLSYSSSTTLALTDSGGRQVPKDLNPPRTNSDLHGRIKQMLPPKARAIFDVLADGKPRPRPEIAQALGYPSDQTAGFKKMLGQVSSLGFLTYPSPSTAQLSDEAFLFPLGEEGRGAGGGAGGDEERLAPPKLAMKPNKSVSGKKKPAAEAGKRTASPPSLPHKVSGDGDDDESGGAEDEDEDPSRGGEDEGQGAETKEASEEDAAPSAEADSASGSEAAAAAANDNEEVEDEENDDDDDEEEEVDSESEWEG